MTGGKSHSEVAVVILEVVGDSGQDHAWGISLGHIHIRRRPVVVVSAKGVENKTSRN